MPTYEYFCEQCGKFDYFQSITDNPLKKCPTCTGNVKRLISMNGNIVFKGQGFYTTDYGRSKDYLHKQKGETKSESKSDQAS